MRNRIYQVGTALASALVIAAGATALRAQSGPCTFGLPQVASTAAAANGTVVPIALVTQGPCDWTVSTNAPTAASLDAPGGTGQATVNVTLTANASAAPRAITVTFNAASASPLSFLITQLGTACTFSVASPPPLAPSGGGSGSFRISTQPNCAWAVSADAPFVTFTPAIGTADPTGSATIDYTVDPNAVNPASGGIDTRITWVTVTNAPAAVNQTWTQITQAGESAGTPDPWNVGDVFAGIGSWWSDFGTYRMLNPDGSVKALPDLHDASGMTTTACMIDPSVDNGDLFTTSWDGLKISRFSGTTHQLVGALDLSPAGLATVQRKTGTVPVPYTQNLMGGFLGQDIAYSEQVVFDQSGNFYVGGSMYASSSEGLGHAYLLKFAKNDDGSVDGCPAASPCLLDWWRVDSGAETPSGPVPAGTNAQWTADYKNAYAAAYTAAFADAYANTVGTVEAKTAAGVAAGNAAGPSAAQDAVAGLAPALSALGAPATAGVDELDLSSDQKTIFYTSEDGHVRRFDTAAGAQLAPLTVTDHDSHLPYGGKVYGFRLLPDGNGHADGGAGMIVAMSTGIFRLDSDAVILKPANAVGYDVIPGVSHPFAMNLTPDAQSFWVATTQEDSSNPTVTGGKIYRFHIPTQRRYGPFNLGTGGADIDIQGLCVKREYTAGVNQCFQTDDNGQGVLDGSGKPIAIPCKNPIVCISIGIDEHGVPNVGCYPPGELPLSIGDRSSFEGDRSGSDGTTDLDLLPLTNGHRIADVVGLPPGLSKDIDPVTRDVIGLTGSVSYNTCPKELERYDLASDPATVCKSYAVGVVAVDGASTSFTWNIHYRNAPPSITSQDATVTALHDLAVPTPASDPDSDDGLIVRARAAAIDPITGAFIADVNPLDYDLRLSSGRMFPSAGSALQVIGNPKGYPLAAPNYPTAFRVTLDLYDCDNSLADSFTPATDLDAVCFHHVTTTFKVTVVNQLPRFISGYDGTGAPIYVNAGVDQFSNKDVSLASAGAEYTLKADDADAHLPVTFTFACTNADGSPNVTACGPNGLPVGLSYAYPGAFGTAPDPATPATNQSVTISGTPGAPANNLLITATLSDRAGGRNAAPFTFHWTVHGGPELSVSDQISPVSQAVSYQIAGTSPNGYHLSYSIAGLPSWLSSSQANDVLTLTGTTPASAPATPPAITITITDQPPAGTTDAETIEATFQWIVHEKPRLSVADQQSGVNLPVTYTLSPLASSPNGFAVTVSASGLPAWLSFNPSTQTFTGTTPAAGGTFPIDVTVTDAIPAGSTAVANPAGSLAALSTTSRFRWFVRQPLALTLADQFTVGGASAIYAIAPKAQSIFPLTFTVQNKPSWLTFDAASQTFSGTAPLAADATPITVTVTENPPAGSGVTGASVTKTFTWTVRMPPVVSAANQSSPANTPVSYTLSPLAGSPNGYAVTVSATALPAWLSFNPSTQTFTGTTPAAGGSFPIVVSVSDHPPAGQPVLTSAATFTWTVITNRQPVCSAATVSPALLWPPNHKLVPFTIGNVVDPDGDRVTVVITSITQDQPIDGLGDGHTPQFDATGVGTSSGAVRAERTGLLRVPEDGRLYQVNFTASDPLGASCTGSVFLGVPHDQGQHDLPADNACRWDSTTGAQLTPCAWLHAPVLTLAARTNDEGDAVNVTFVATDPDNTPLTYSVSGLPPGLTMSPSGVVTGTIAAGAAGSKGSKKFTVTVTVNDGYGASTASFAWTIRRR